MISIAGVIGAGLFIGSATAINAAGPAVLIAYALAGTLVVLVMRMLGEMATAHPDTGSFSTYADRALGRWAGFSIGWLYWWFWVIVIPVEATAGALILHNWMGGVPQWAFALLITGLLMGTNLFSVANYGEFEFWFALVKVVAIVAFIAVGLLAIFGVLPGSHTSGLSHLTSDGGFMPHGFGAVIAAMLTTMFTFMGTEIVTIAAAESPNPEQGIRKAVNSVIWRISLFYLGLDLRGRRPRRVELPAADRAWLLPVRPGPDRARQPRTGARPGDPHRRRVLPELRALHRLPYGVLALQPW